MTKEADALAADLKAVLAELYPYRSYDKVRLDDQVVALGVLLRRPPAGAGGNRKSLKHTVDLVAQDGLRHLLKQFPRRYADGAESGPSARPRDPLEGVE